MLLDYCTSGSCLCPHQTEDDHEDYEDVENVERDSNTEGGEEDWLQSVEKMIMDAGYYVESHEIRTADGYLLTYHRIPNGKSSNPNVVPNYRDRNKGLGPPVLVQHGILCSSASWAMSPNALAFVLADAGYDVWLGNARGNTFSRKHMKLNPDKHSKFWDFSWHEMGFYDLPASIDYILRTTERTQLFYIGHSMGTTMYFVLGTTRPNYMSKIKAAVLLSPVMYPYHVRSPFGTFIPIMSLFVNCLTKGNELLGNKGGMTWVNKHICRSEKLQFACRGVYFALCGFDKDQFDKIAADNIFRFTPAGVSRMALQHFIQIKRESMGFRLYDYGTRNFGNMWMYGTSLPPEYILQRLTAPMYIYYAENDLLIAPKDVHFTLDRLPKTSVVELKKVPLDKFSHIDFMWAKDAKTLCYDDILKNLKSASKTSLSELLQV